MTYSENAINILTIETYKGIGKAKINSYLKGNESIEKIIEFINNHSKENTNIAEFELKKDKIREKLENLNDSCDGLIAIGDKDFPQIRENVPASEKPVFLFYKGDIELLQEYNHNISVIGLLNPTDEIVQREKLIIQYIIKENMTVVSGLAFGCDSVAHMESLKGGKTIAILPSPLNNILPKSNRQLAYDIVENEGLLISEYYEDTENYYKLSQRYKERDRLQALFCDAIILIASYSKDSMEKWPNLNNQKLDSGARLAMEYAKKYNIPRAVMYNKDLDENNPMFDLNRDLIKENAIILNKKNLKLIIDTIKQKNNINIKQGSLFE